MHAPFVSRDDLMKLRQEYATGGLTEDALAADWFTQFQRWLADIVSASSTVGALLEPNAMVLTTVAADGCPSARTVLLKDVAEQGFVFFTNYESAKGKQLAENACVSLLFPWYLLRRQVMVQGSASRLSAPESDTYFALRPRGAQLAALASAQSTVLADRAELDAAYAEVSARLDGEAKVPRPDNWGGYLVRPTSVEFWQGARNRLHDRLRYREAGERWVLERLAP